MTAATSAPKLLNQKKVLRDRLSSILAANEASALARMRIIGTAQLIRRSTNGKFGSLGGRWWVNMKLNHSQLCV